MRLTAALLAATAMVASAGTISTTGQNNANPIDAIDITGSATTGAMMDGLLVTGLFTGNNSISCVWADTGANSGGCSASGGGSGFSINLNGDTFSASWNLSAITGTASLLSLTFDGLPGFTVFDRTFSNNTGTSGSASGSDASGSVTDGQNFDIDGSAVYFIPVGTLGNAPVGDEFARVVISFDSGGIRPGMTASWTMDTDNIGLRGGDPGSGVPEPSTFAMMGAALAGVAVLRRRKS